MTRIFMLIFIVVFTSGICSADSLENKLHAYKSIEKSCVENEPLHFLGKSVFNQCKETLLIFLIDANPEKILTILEHEKDIECYSTLLSALHEKYSYLEFQKKSDSSYDFRLLKLLQKSSEKFNASNSIEAVRSSLHLVNIPARMKYLRNYVPASRDSTGLNYILKAAKEEEQKGNYEVAAQKYTEFLNSADYSVEGYEYDYITYNTGAIFLYRLNDSESALPHFNKVIELFPLSEYAMWAYFDKGEIYQRGSKFDEARALYQEIINIFPEYPLVTSKSEFETGMSYYNEKKYENARTHFEKVISSLPFLKDAATFWTGETYFVNSDFDSARPFYQSVISKYPDSEYVPLAEARLANNDYNDPEKMFADAMQAYSDGKYSDAIAKFDLVLKYHPEHEKAEPSLLYKGICFYKLEQYNECISAMKSYLASYSTDAHQAQRYIADSYYKLSDFDNAAREYQALVDLYSDKIQDAPAIQYLVGVIYSEKLKNYQNAVTAFKKVVEKFKASNEAAAAIFDAGQCYRMIGEYQNALSWYHEVIIQYPGEYKIIAKALFEQGNMFQLMEDYDSAIAKYTEVISGNQPEQFKKDAAQYEIGECYRKQNKYPESQSAYQSVINTYPDSPYVSLAQEALNSIPQDNHAAYEQALIYYNNGQYEQAISLFEKYLSTNSYEAQASYALFYLAESYFQIAQYLESLQKLNLFRYKYASHEYVWKCQIRIAECQENLEQYSAAITEYKKLLAQYDNSLFEAGFYQYHIGNLYQLKMFRLLDAITEYTTLIQKFPESIYAKYAPFDISGCYKKLGKTSDALATLLSVINNASSDATMKVRAYVETGMIKFELSEYAQAIDNFNKGIMVPDGDYRKDMAQYYIGECYLALDNKLKAKIAYNAVITNFPESPFVDKAIARLAEIGDEQGMVQITITPFIRELIPNQELSLSVLIKDAYGNTVYPGKLNWSSDNTAVIGIDSTTGLLKSVASGTANITVKTGDYTATDKFTVKEIVSLEPGVWYDVNQSSGLSDWFMVNTAQAGTVYIEIDGNSNFNFRALKSDMVTILGYGPSARVRKEAGQPVYIVAERFSTPDAKSLYRLRAQFVPDRALAGGEK